jgi:hypothetical protein
MIVCLSLMFLYSLNEKKLKYIYILISLFILSLAYYLLAILLAILLTKLIRLLDKQVKKSFLSKKQDVNVNHQTSISIVDVQSHSDILEPVFIRLVVQLAYMLTLGFPSETVPLIIK